MSGDVVQDSIDIDAPPGTVFAILADPRQHARIDGGGTVRGLVSGPDRLTQGARFGMRMRLFGLPYSIGNTVVEFEEDRLIAWRHLGPHRWRYRLEPLPGGGTRVTETWDASRYPGPTGYGLRLAGFPARNRGAIENTLVRLKAVAEADSDTST